MCRNRAGCTTGRPLIRDTIQGLGEIRNVMRRTHRWQRVLRHDDDTTFAREDHVHAALFSTHPDDVRLYGKPMARNAQIWSSRFDAVLHGPAAGREEIESATRQMEQGGSFGYRLFYPPMQVGQSAVFWHRPLIAFWNGTDGRDAGLRLEWLSGDGGFGRRVVAAIRRQSFSPRLRGECGANARRGGAGHCR